MKKKTVRNIILGSIGGVVTATAALYGTANYFFQLAIVRPDKGKPGRNPHNIVASQAKSKVQFSAHTDEVAAAKEWLRSQPLETIYTKSFDNLTLAAEILDCEDAKGTIIAVHSFCSSPLKDFGDVAKYYHELGYRVVMPYQRAHEKSEGYYITYGIKECRDIVEWTGVIERRYGKNENVFLHGVSMGATTVLMATGYQELSPNVRGVIADSAFISPYRLFRNIVKKDLHLPAFPFLYAMEAIAKEEADFGFSDYSTLEALDDCTRPILLLHGEDDALVPVSMAHENYEACHTEKELVIIPGAQHALGYLVDKETCKAAVYDFLDRYTILV